MSKSYTKKEIEKILFAEASALISKFVYTPDEENYGRPEDWRIPEPREDGKIYDDCDGYCMYLWDKLRRDYDLDSNIIFCEVPVREGYGGHAVLYCHEWLMDCNHWNPWRKNSVYNWKWISMSDPYLTPTGWRQIDE